MKAKKIALPSIGQMTDDGLFIDTIRLESKRVGIILPPKSIRQQRPTVWNGSEKSVKGALSYFDGLANTIAMAKAGSKIAQWALDNGMHIPAQDELEPCYRITKPTADKNWCYARSGINLSVAVPTYPYTPDFPKQTKIKEFQIGGAEAFENAYYWTSTQHPGYSDYAFIQYFADGTQDSYRRSLTYRAVAVRRIQIKD